MRVLITGATGNLGKAVATIAQEEGAEVVRTSRSGNEDSIGLDLRHWGASVYLVAKQEPFDMVVMAHGIGNVTSMTDMSPAVWNLVIDTNLISCVALTHALIEGKKLNTGSLIVYCSSIQANTPRAGRAAYSVSKAGLEAFCKVVAAELAPDVRAIALRLGQMDKTMGDIKFTGTERATLEKRAYLPWVPVKDVAELCFDLYKQRSLTASIIEIDSGHGRNVW